MGWNDNGHRGYGGHGGYGGGYQNRGYNDHRRSGGGGRFDHRDNRGRRDHRDNRDRGDREQERAERTKNRTYLERLDMETWLAMVPEEKREVFGKHPSLKRMISGRFKEFLDTVDESMLPKHIAMAVGFHKYEN